MSKCLWSGWKWLKVVKELACPFPCYPINREYSWKKILIEKKNFSSAIFTQGSSSTLEARFTAQESYDTEGAKYLLTLDLKQFKSNENESWERCSRLLLVQSQQWKQNNVWNLFKVKIRTPERRQWRSGVFILNFKEILHIVLVFLLLNLNK